MKRLLAPFILLLSMQCSPSEVVAQANYYPDRLALSISNFPQPAEIVVSRVEPNDMVAADEVVLSGPSSLVEEGRITGYLMQALQPNIDASENPHPVVTLYIASIFSTDAKAAAAFQQERKGWDALALAPQPDRAVSRIDVSGLHVGDAGQAASYSVLVKAQQGQTVVQELLFSTGSAFVQVWQYYLSTDAQPYGQAARPFVGVVGRRLDKLVRSIPGIAPAAFTVLSVRAEPYGAAFGPNARGLKRVPKGTHVYIAVYVSITKGPPQAPMTARITVLRGTKLRGDYVLTQNLDSSPEHVYRLYVPFRFNALGPITLRSSVRVDGVSRSAQSYLVVVK